jgi:hypothetical protein
VEQHYQKRVYPYLVRLFFALSGCLIFEFSTSPPAPFCHKTILKTASRQRPLQIHDRTRKSSSALRGVSDCPRLLACRAKLTRPI